MKKIKLLFSVLLALILILALAACKGETTYYTVEFDSQGGSAVQSRAVEGGTVFSEPEAPTRTGFTFAGWYNGETKWNFETDTVTSNMKLTAKWDRISHTVSFNSDGGSAVAKQYIEEGTKAAEPTAPTKPNYVFDGWYNGETKWNFDTDTVNANVTLTAKWKVTYTVTFNSNGGSEVAPIEVPIGEKITPPSVTRTYAFIEGWFIGDTDEEWNFEEDVVTEPITLRAEWIFTTPPMPL